MTPCLLVAPCLRVAYIGASTTPKQMTLTSVSGRSLGKVVDASLATGVLASRIGATPTTEAIKRALPGIAR